jgi:hypothetical protein
MRPWYRGGFHESSVAQKAFRISNYDTPNLAAAMSDLDKRLLLPERDHNSTTITSRLDALLNGS